MAPAPPPPPPPPKHRPPPPPPEVAPQKKNQKTPKKSPKAKAAAPPPSHALPPSQPPEAPRAPPQVSVAPVPPPRRLSSSANVQDRPGLRGTVVVAYIGGSEAPRKVQAPEAPRAPPQVRAAPLPPPRRMSSLKGSEMVIANVQDRPELRGTVVVAQTWFPAAQQWEVQLPDGSQVTVGPESLEKLDGTKLDVEAECLVTDEVRVCIDSMTPDKRTMEYDSQSEVHSVDEAAFNSHAWLSSELLTVARHMSAELFQSDPAVLQDLIIKFKHYDDNHDGMMSWGEFQEHIEEIKSAINFQGGHTTRELFDLMDNDHENGIDFAEFLFFSLSCKHHGLTADHRASKKLVSHFHRIKKDVQWTWLEEHYLRLPSAPKDGIKLGCIRVQNKRCSKILKACQIFFLLRLLPMCDVISDVFVVVFIKWSKDPWWGVLTVFFLLCPQLVKSYLFKQIVKKKFFSQRDGQGKGEGVLRTIWKMVYLVFGAVIFFLIDAYLFFFYPWLNPTDAEFLGTVERLSPILECFLESFWQSILQVYMYKRLKDLDRTEDQEMVELLLASFVIACGSMCIKIIGLKADARAMNMPFFSYVKELVKGPLGLSAPFAHLLTKRHQLSYVRIGALTDAQQTQIFKALGKQNRVLHEIEFDDLNEIKLEGLASELSSNDAMQYVGLGCKYSLTEVHRFFTCVGAGEFEATVAFSSGDFGIAFDSVSWRTWTQDMGKLLENMRTHLKVTPSCQKGMSETLAFLRAARLRLGLQKEEPEEVQLLTHIERMDETMRQMENAKTSRELQSAIDEARKSGVDDTLLQTWQCRVQCMTKMAAASTFAEFQDAVKASKESGISNSVLQIWHHKGECIRQLESASTSASLNDALHVGLSHHVSSQVLHVWQQRVEVLRKMETATDSQALENAIAAAEQSGLHKNVLKVWREKIVYIQRMEAAIDSEHLQKLIRETTSAGLSNQALHAWQSRSNAIQKMESSVNSEELQQVLGHAQVVGVSKKVLEIWEARVTQLQQMKVAFEQADRAGLETRISDAGQAGIFAQVLDSWRHRLKLFEKIETATNSSSLQTAIHEIQNEQHCTIRQDVLDSWLSKMKGMQDMEKMQAEWAAHHGGAPTQASVAKETVDYNKNCQWAALHGAG